MSAIYVLNMQFGELQREHSAFKKQDGITGHKMTLQAEVHSLKSQIKVLEAEVEGRDATIRETKVLLIYFYKLL